MTIHKKTRLTPIQRKALVEDYYQKHKRVCDLMRQYSVSAPTVYKIIHRARDNDYSIHRSVNHRYRCLPYGLKRLERIEKEIEERLKNKARRYNKKYPGEMVHVDTKRLPLLRGESTKETHEYLFVAIDDYSRELFAGIFPDKTQYSSEKFLKQVIDECSYTIEQIYSDNGLEYKGDPEHHAFMRICKEHNIEQRFTKVKHPYTNGKAERVIRTVSDMWHSKTEFKSHIHRKTELIRFINYYNTVKPHRSLDDKTPMEYLIEYFYPQKL